MSLQPGTTYLLSFTQKFSALNGIYTCVATTTFADAIASGVDIEKSLYTPLNLTETDYSADYSSYLQDRVYVCQSVTNTETVYYIPESIISGTPDPTVKAYYRVVVACDIGLFADINKGAPLVSLFQDQITAYTGNTNSVALLTNSENPQYFTDAQYQAYQATLQKSASTLIPLTQQLTTALKENQELKSRLAAYEADYIAQATKGGTT